MSTTPPGAAIPPRRQGRVTRAMAQARTRELAVLAGRNSLAITQSDYEQARRELTGETDMTRQEAVFDAPAPADRQPGQTVAAVAAWENEGGQTVPPPPLNPNG